MLGSFQCLAEASDEGLGSSSILVGWSLCDLGHQSPLSEPSFYPKDEDGILSPNLPSRTSAGTPLAHRKMEAWRSFPGGVWVFAQASVVSALLHSGSGQSRVDLLFLRPLCWSTFQAKGSEY